MNYKSIAIASLVVFGTISSAYADDARCSLSTLKGTYIYNSQGAENGAPFAESGKEVYDGKGGVLTTYTNNLGSGTQVGTYTVGSDCNGTVSYVGGDVDKFYASPKGDSFTYITVGKSISGTETRVSR